jgi:hypothetical protein
MLLDFLKGNHFEVDTTTMLWLWVAEELACCNKMSFMVGLDLRPLQAVSYGPGALSQVMLWARGAVPGQVQLGREVSGADAQAQVVRRRNEVPQVQLGGHW